MSENKRNGFVESLTDALRPMSLLKKLLFVIIVITVLSVRELIQYLNLWGDGQISFLKAIGSTYYDGLAVVFSSTWVFLTNLILLKLDLGIGDIFFGILFLAGAFYVLFEPISLTINIIDMKKGHASPLFIRLLATFIFVLLVSAIVYFSGGESAIGVSLPINQTIVNSTINITNVTNSTGGVITLI